MLTVLRCCIEELHANESSQLADTDNELMVSRRGIVNNDEFCHQMTDRLLDLLPMYDKLISCRMFSTFIV